MRYNIIEREKSMNKISIVIADDHALVRQGTRSLLEREKDLEVEAVRAVHAGEKTLPPSCLSV